MKLTQYLSLNVYKIRLRKIQLPSRITVNCEGNFVLIILVLVWN